MNIALCCSCIIARTVSARRTLLLKPSSGDGAFTTGSGAGERDRHGGGGGREAGAEGIILAPRRELSQGARPSRGGALSVLRGGSAPPRRRSRRRART